MLKSVLMDNNEGLYIDITDLINRLNNIRLAVKKSTPVVPTPDPEKTENVLHFWSPLHLGDQAMFKAWRMVFTFTCSEYEAEEPWRNNQRVLKLVKGEIGEDDNTTYYSVFDPITLAKGAKYYGKHEGFWKYSNHSMYKYRKPKGDYLYDIKGQTSLTATKMNTMEWWDKDDTGQWIQSDAPNPGTPLSWERDSGSYQYVEGTSWYVETGYTEDYAPINITNFIAGHPDTLAVREVKTAKTPINYDTDFFVEEDYLSLLKKLHHADGYDHGNDTFFDGDQYNIRLPLLGLTIYTVELPDITEATLSYTEGSYKILSDFTTIDEVSYTILNTNINYTDLDVGTKLYNNEPSGPKNITLYNAYIRYDVPFYYDADDTVAESPIYYTKMGEPISLEAYKDTTYNYIGLEPAECINVRSSTGYIDPDSFNEYSFFKKDDYYESSISFDFTPASSYTDKVVSIEETDTYRRIDHEYTFNYEQGNSKYFPSPTKLSAHFSGYTPLSAFTEYYREEDVQGIISDLTMINTENSGLDITGFHDKRQLVEDTEEPTFSNTEDIMTTLVQTNNVISNDLSVVATSFSSVYTDSTYTKRNNHAIAYFMKDSQGVMRLLAQFTQYGKEAWVTPCFSAIPYFYNDQEIYLNFGDNAHILSTGHGTLEDMIPILASYAIAKESFISATNGILVRDPSKDEGNTLGGVYVLSIANTTDMLPDTEKIYYAKQPTRDSFFNCINAGIHSELHDYSVNSE